MTALTQQDGRQRHQMTGYYTAKRKALRPDHTRLDRRKRTDRQIVKDRQDFKRLCGRKGYTLRRRELWRIVEKFKRVMNAVEPIIFARESLVNKRRKIIMPLAIDYVSLVRQYRDSIKDAFDGLPERREPDLWEKMQRDLRREERKAVKEKSNGEAMPSIEGSGEGEDT